MEIMLKIKSCRLGSSFQQQPQLHDDQHESSQAGYSCCKEDRSVGLNGKLSKAMFMEKGL